MATKTYKPKRKISATESEEIKFPASSVDGLSTVATSGSYNDLSNKPSIPANYTTSSRTPSQCTANGFYYVVSSVNSLTDANGNPFLQYHTSNNDFRILTTAYSDSWVQQIATDFTSTHIYYRIRNNGTWGAWTEVAKISDIPTVNNGTLTIQKNGTAVATFSANQSTNATANITVPTKVSDLTNDSGYTTNKGTVTQVKINGATKSPDSAGLVDLGTVGGGGATDAVKYTPQTLTASQKTQARSNIGAGTGNGTVTGVKINGSTKGTSGVVDLGYIQVKVNGTTYTADSSGLIDLGAIGGGGTVYANIYNDIY